MFCFCCEQIWISWHLFQVFENTRKLRCARVTDFGDFFFFTKHLLLIVL